MARSGALLVLNFAKFSFMSKTIEIDIINAIEYIYVPINFFMM